MWSIIAKVLVNIVAHADDIEGLVAAVGDEVNAVATGKGGPQKVANAATALQAVAAHVGKIATDVATAS